MYSTPQVMNQDTARNSSNHEPYKNKVVKSLFGIILVIFQCGFCRNCIRHLQGSLENYLPSTKDDQSTSKRKVCISILNFSIVDVQSHIFDSLYYCFSLNQRVYGQFQSEEFWTLDENHETVLLHYLFIYFKFVQFAQLMILLYFKNVCF